MYTRRQALLGAAAAAMLAAMPLLATAADETENAALARAWEKQGIGSPPKWVDRVWFRSAPEVCGGTNKRPAGFASVCRSGRCGMRRARCS